MTPAALRAAVQLMVLVLRLLLQPLQVSGPGPARTRKAIREGAVLQKGVGSHGRMTLTPARQAEVVVIAMLRCVMVGGEILVVAKVRLLARTPVEPSDQEVEAAATAWTEVSARMLRAAVGLPVIAMAMITARGAAEIMVVRTAAAIVVRVGRTKMTGVEIVVAPVAAIVATPVVETALEIRQATVVIEEPIAVANATVAQPVVVPIVSEMAIAATSALATRSGPGVAADQFTVCG